MLPRLALLTGILVAPFDPLAAQPCPIAPADAEAAGIAASVKALCLGGLGGHADLADRVFTWEERSHQGPALICYRRQRGEQARAIATGWQSQPPALRVPYCLAMAGRVYSHLLYALEKNPALLHSGQSPPLAPLR